MPACTESATLYVLHCRILVASTSARSRSCWQRSYTPTHQRSPTILALPQEPVPHITAHPSSNSILQWHFVLEGSPGTEFEGGVYHGKVTFPPQYPFKPPSISLYTPNGRFAVNTRLCLSMTDFHPESWCDFAYLFEITAFGRRLLWPQGSQRVSKPPVTHVELLLSFPKQYQCFKARELR